MKMNRESGFQQRGKILKKNKFERFYLLYIPMFGLVYQ